MFRKLISYLLLALLLTVGITIHQEEPGIAYADTLEIQGRIGGSKDSSSFSGESGSQETDVELARPKENEILLRKLPSTGELKNYFVFFGVALMVCVYGVNKKYKQKKRLGHSS